MYRCERCNCVVQPHSPAIKVVAETREREYASRSHANPKSGNGRSRGKHDPGGSGAEIVREMMVCQECAASFAPPLEA